LGWLLLLLCLAGAAGCAHQKPAPKPAIPPRQVVLDYGNGWYHTADGLQTIAQISRLYYREPELVALLNRATAEFRPTKGTMLYIPPTNDRERLRAVLTKVQAHPELIPRTPWNPATPMLKTVDPGTLKIKHGQGRKIVEEPKRSWFFGRKRKKAAPAPAAAAPVQVAAAAKPAGDSRQFQRPVSGQIITKFKAGWQSACHGIEIAAPDGTPVCAARAGKVLLAAPSNGYGNLIIIDHGDGFATTYGYNQEMCVKEGDRVTAGQKIASVGRPSRGSGSRLFFQIRRNALPVDPEKFIQ
jgi:murein DD-endopeptidase MepM/ murein hydrolase activator NlpD